MISEAIMITLIGMGGVFVFLFLMICGMNILRIALTGSKRNDLDKVAVAIALARHQQQGE